MNQTQINIDVIKSESLYDEYVYLMNMMKDTALLIKKLVKL